MHPVKVRPRSSKLMVTRAGRRVFSFTASSAALASYRSVMVSMAARSAPASAPATAISRKMSTASSNVSEPKGSSSAPMGPMSSPTRQSVPSAAFLAAATAACTTSATVWPVSASFSRLAPKVLV